MQAKFNRKPTIIQSKNDEASTDEPTDKKEVSKHEFKRRARSALPEDLTFYRD